MAQIAISLPDPVIPWIEAIIVKAEYTSFSEYVCDLVRRDRERRGEELSSDEIQSIIHDAKVGGMSAKTVEQIFDETTKRVRTDRTRE